jgi:hypothetical protein
MAGFEPRSYVSRANLMATAPGEMCLVFKIAPGVEIWLPGLNVLFLPLPSFKEISEMG